MERAEEPRVRDTQNRTTRRRTAATTAIRTRDWFRRRCAGVVPRGWYLSRARFSDMFGRVRWDTRSDGGKGGMKGRERWRQTDAPVRRDVERLPSRISI